MSELAEWLSDDVPELERAIVRRAMCDIGIVEMPPGSNRSPRIDEYVAAVGSPAGSRWCAAALAAWWRECGAAVPVTDAGSCNAWMAWSKRLGRWSSTAGIGSAVLYGRDGIAAHVGVIVRMVPALLSVEGNTNVGCGLSANGIAVALKQVATARVLGYIAPTPM